MADGGVWRGHPEVLELIRNRVNGSGGDGARVHLCVDGGALRGVVTSGMCHALADSGWLWSFDGYASVSSGTPNLLWALAGGSMDEGLGVYTEIAGRVAVRPRRPVLDLDPLSRFWSQRIDALDAALGAVGDRALRVAVCRAGDPDAEVAHLERFSDRSELVAAMVGGCWLPVVGGFAPRVDSNGNIDGGFVHPCADSLATDATHLVVLSTRPDHQLPRAPQRHSRVASAAMTMQHRGLARRWEVSQRDAARRWQEWSVTGLLAGRPTVRISVHHALSRLTRDAGRLAAAARTSYAATAHTVATLTAVGP